MRTSRLCFVLAFVLAALLVSGCAATPPGTSERTLREFALSTTTVSSEPTRTLAVEGASCTLRNDKGRWQVVTPGRVAVELSAQPLVVECRKDGLVSGALELHCTIGDSQAGKGAASGALLMVLSSGGLALLVPAWIAGGALAGAVLAGPGGEACNYPATGELEVLLMPITPPP